MFLLVLNLLIVALVGIGAAQKGSGGGGKSGRNQDWGAKGASTYERKGDGGRKGAPDPGDYAIGSTPNALPSGGRKPRSTYSSDGTTERLFFMFGNVSQSWGARRTEHIGLINEVRALADQRMMYHKHAFTDAMRWKIAESNRRLMLIQRVWTVQGCVPSSVAPENLGDKSAEEHDQHVASSVGLTVDELRFLERDPVSVHYYLDQMRENDLNGTDMSETVDIHWQPDTVSNEVMQTAISTANTLISEKHNSGAGKGSRPSGGYNRVRSPSTACQPCGTCSCGDSNGSNNAANQRTSSASACGRTYLAKLRSHPPGLIASHKDETQVVIRKHTMVVCGYGQMCIGLGCEFSRGNVTADGSVFVGTRSIGFYNKTRCPDGDQGKGCSCVTPGWWGSGTRTGATCTGTILPTRGVFYNRPLMSGHLGYGSRVNTWLRVANLAIHSGYGYQFSAHSCPVEFRGTPFCWFKPVTQCGYDWKTVNSDGWVLEPEYRAVCRHMLGNNAEQRHMDLCALDELYMYRLIAQQYMQLQPDIEQKIRELYFNEDNLKVYGSETATVDSQSEFGEKEPFLLHESGKAGTVNPNLKWAALHIRATDNRGRWRHDTCQYATRLEYLIREYKPPDFDQEWQELLQTPGGWHNSLERLHEDASLSPENKDIRAKFEFSAEELVQGRAEPERIELVEEMKRRVERAKQLKQEYGERVDERDSIADKVARARASWDSQGPTELRTVFIATDNCTTIEDFQRCDSYERNRWVIRSFCHGNKDAKTQDHYGSETKDQSQEPEKEPEAVVSSSSKGSGSVYDSATEATYGDSDSPSSSDSSSMTAVTRRQMDELRENLDELVDCIVLGECEENELENIPYTAEMLETQGKGGKGGKGKAWFHPKRGVTAETMYRLWAEILLMKEADFVVGTFSSNMGRLVQVLRSQPQQTMESLDTRWKPG